MATILMRYFSTRFPLTICNTRLKHTILDYSRVPKISNEDLEESCVRGSGPGGQAVNKTSNAIILKHVPSGVVVKCHQTRSLSRNREIALEILTNKLDNLINGDLSIESQKKKILDKKSKENVRKTKKLNELKSEWKKREGL